MKSRIACILLVVGGILVVGLFLHFSYDPKERFTKAATYAYLGYTLRANISETGLVLLINEE